MRLNRCTLLNEAISVEFNDGKLAEFSLFWLRDHSTDSSSLNSDTFQRDVDTFSLANIPSIKTSSVIQEGKVLQVCWQDNDLISDYGADFLYQMAYGPSTEPQQSLWASEFQDNIPNFDFNQVTQEGESFLPVLNAIEQFGIVTFSGLSTDTSSTKKLLQQIGYIRETVFGGLWDFSNNQAHSDSAYTSVGIGLHTDGCYSLDPPGLQLLHCLAFEGEGAINQFVDGFKVAQTIKEESPEDYQLLTKIKVPAHYIEPGIQLRAEHEVIREGRHRQFEQVCFNNYDRSPLMLAGEKQKDFYRAYGMFYKLINDSAFQVNLQLRPGRAVWFDNWRVLHARTAFSGFRHLAGGYTNREDYISKLLTLRGKTPWKE